MSCKRMGEVSTGFVGHSGACQKLTTHHQKKDCFPHKDGYSTYVTIQHIYTASVRITDAAADILLHHVSELTVMITEGLTTSKILHKAVVAVALDRVVLAACKQQSLMHACV